MPLNALSYNVLLLQKIRTDFKEPKEPKFVLITVNLYKNLCRLTWENASPQLQVFTASFVVGSSLLKVCYIKVSL